jgi:SAM-dependent methyltransferase
MTWFASWFDSPYYHILYQHRDEAEAQFFMDNLLSKLQLPAAARVLDLACGKGRHSIYLEQKGCRVVGADLSPESIAAAKAFENEHLEFVVHDMRETLDKGDFDAVFNLFTSFGYFTKEEEHIAVLSAARQNILAKNGVLVIDFMNAQKVIQNLVLAEEKTVKGIHFKIRRFVENGYIVKEIRFSDGGEDYHFEERVRGFLLADFEALFAKAGLRLEASFGNYALAAFKPETAERLILFARPC